MNIIDCCRNGDFVEAQRQLQELGDECVRDPGNHALTSAYADLCSVFSYHLQIRARTYADLTSSPPCNQAKT